MEKRMMDVALRRGIHHFTVAKWREYLRIKKEFDTLLPNGMENSYIDLV